MPFANEHAARQNAPGKYARFRRENNKFGQGIHAIWGITSDDKTEVQSIRFDKTKFSVAEARKWLEDHDYKTNIEAASGDDNMSEFISDFLFAEVEPSAKAVEFLMEGEFPDRYGREVKITEADLDEYIANFEANAAGQNVPIDIDHEKTSAAGWVKRVWREGKKLFAEPDWNKLGKDLVGNKIYLYLSATLDTKNKIIKSISLVNFPAVKGLKPVELSEGIYHLEGNNSFTNAASHALAAFDEARSRLLQSMNWFQTSLSTPEEDYIDTRISEETIMSDEERAKLKEEVRQELQAELAQQQQTRAELREEVRKDVEAELREVFNRRQGIVEFANEICGGEFGLSTPPDEVVEFLEAVPAGWLEKAKAILKAKVVEFGERGSSQDGQPNGGDKLPEYAIKDVKAGDFTVAELFKHNVLAGAPGDYDLSEFTDEQRGGV